MPAALPEGASLEGFLWPETYRIPKRDDADAVIQRLLDQFAEETAGLPWENAEALGVTPYEIVVIASMIEKEAAVQRDRPLIAGVIYNRLREGMTLGIDATLLYDDPTPDGELSTADIETDGPYNTRHPGGLAADTDREPVPLVAARGPRAGRHAVLLLRALRRRRRAPVRGHLRRASGQRRCLPRLSRRRRSAAARISPA